MIKVMIADDEENVCQLIRSLIDWPSLEMEIVGIAHNGVEALGMISELSPDLMITDIRMPGCDGLEMIQRAQNLKSGLDFIIISGYRHFEYAQNAIKFGVSDYLLKPIKKEELLAALRKMRERYLQRTNRLSEEERLKARLKSDIDKLHADLFTECLSEKGQPTALTLESANENYHYSFQPGLFRACEVKIDCGYEDQYNSAVGILTEKVEQILAGYLREFCHDLGFYRNDSAVDCIANFSPENQKAIHRQLRAVMDELLVQKTVFTQMEFTIGTGMAVEEIGRLRDSMAAARFAVGQRLAEGTGKLIHGEEPPPVPDTASELLPEIRKKMSAALELLDKDAVLRCIDELKNGAVEHHLTGCEIFSLAEQLCGMYLLDLRGIGIPVVYGDEFLEKFHVHASRCGSIPQIFQYLALLVGNSLDVIIEQKRQMDTKPIRLAKQYIQQNYMKPIGLEEVSGVVGFSPAYFSTLFKRENGGNFVEYLTGIRMGKAKDLLKETNLSVAVICEQVGYSDLKHFTHSFRNLTGLKPNEYRKLYS